MRGTFEAFARPMSIGALSRRTGFSIDTIRYYERLGLLPEVGRTARGHRLYGDEHVRRLRFVRRGRELGLRLRQMHELLCRDKSCEDVSALLRERAADVRRRLAELRMLDLELRRLLDACGDADLTNCRIIEVMLAGDEQGDSVQTCCTRLSA